MTNPFDELRKKREAEDARRLQTIELQKAATAKAEEDKKYATDLSFQYSKMVYRVLGQLIEAAYPAQEICDYSVPDSWDPEIDQLFKPWRPTWCIGHTQVYDFKDDDHTRFVSYDFSVKVSIDFDKNHTPGFFCTDGKKTAACALSETELIKTLLDLLK